MGCGLCFEIGVHCVGEIAGSVDDFRVSSLNLNMPLKVQMVIVWGSSVREWRWAKLAGVRSFLDSKFGAESIRSWVRHFGEGHHFCTRKQDFAQRQRKI